jgi:sugar phosphate isomerase/epimerase
MKLSVVASVPENGRFLPFEKSMKLASRLGYDGVELNIRDPRRIEERKLVKTLSDLDLRASCIITGQGFTVDGLSLVDPSARTRKLAVQRIKDHILLAGSLSSIVLIGWMRGIWKYNRMRARRRFLEGLRVCAESAQDSGVLMGIECINRYEVDSINTLDEALATIREVDLGNVGIVADTFHMNIEEDKPIYEKIVICKNRLFHVHVADNNRKVPGAGHLPFRRFFDSLRRMSYDRFVSVEVVPPEPSFASIAESSMTYLQKIV